MNSIFYRVSIRKYKSQPVQLVSFEQILCDTKFVYPF